MGRRGPPAIPTTLSVASGSKRAQNPLEPKSPAGVPEAPDWLPKEARGDYEQFGRTLSELGVVTKSDALMLGLLADSVSHYRACTAKVHAEGFVDDAHRGAKSKVELQQLHKFRDAILRLGREFGLSPSARVGLIDQAELEQRERDRQYFGTPA